MNKYAVIFIALLASGCVSMKEYKAKVAELDELAVAAKTTRKEIRDLQKEQKVLLDTIAQRTVRAKAKSEAIKKRLAANKVKISLDPKKLEGISVRDADPDPAFADEMWRTYTSRDTNSAKNTTWLTPSERKIYYYLNLARLNPRGFCDRYVAPKLRYDSSNVYLLTLIDYMYTMKPRNAVVPDKVQFENAKCHATSSGKLGYVGHQRQSKTCHSSFSGECCSYGLSDPLEVVLQLLIDNGVPSLGHRYICLGWYEKCGIALAPHSGYGTNVVLDFH